MTNSRLTLFAAAIMVSTGLGALPAAAASQFILTDGTVPGGLVGTDLTGLVTYTGTPAINEGAYIGPLNMTVTDATTHISVQQTVFCTDIFHNYSAGGLYNLSSTSLGSLGATKVNQLNALLSHALPLDPSSGAAIQAAIWEIENEPVTTGYSVANGVFQASIGSNPTFDSDAASYLANVTNGTWLPTAGTVVEEYTVVLGQSPNQSFGFLGLSGNTNNTPVPEPASMLLLGFGAVAVAGLRRKSHA